MGRFDQCLRSFFYYLKKSHLISILIEKNILSKVLPQNEILISFLVKKNAEPGVKTIAHLQVKWSVPKRWVSGSLVSLMYVWGENCKTSAFFDNLYFGLILTSNIANNVGCIWDEAINQ